MDPTGAELNSSSPPDSFFSKLFVKKQDTPMAQITSNILRVFLHPDYSIEQRIALLTDRPDGSRKPKAAMMNQALRAITQAYAQMYTEQILENYERAVSYREFIKALRSTYRLAIWQYADASMEDQRALDHTDALFRRIDLSEAESAAKELA
jgi:hypothetical protein